MDTVFLIPRSLTVVQIPHPDPDMNGRELDATVWARSRLVAGQRFDLSQGQLRLERLEIFSKLPKSDVSIHIITKVIGKHYIYTYIYIYIYILICLLIGDVYVYVTIVLLQSDAVISMSYIIIIL